LNPVAQTSATPAPVLRELPAGSLNEALLIAFGENFRMIAAQGRSRNMAVAAGP
jgi:hypothetical protein